MLCSCSQVGPGADELGATWKVPRFLGYASACREGSIVGDDEVEKLNSADEEVLNKANNVSLDTAAKPYNLQFRLRHCRKTSRHHLNSHHPSCLQGVTRNTAQ